METPEMTDPKPNPADRPFGLHRLREAADAVQAELAAFGRRMFGGSAQDMPGTAADQAGYWGMPGPLRGLFGRLIGPAPKPVPPQPPAPPREPAAKPGREPKHAPEGAQFLASSY